MHTSPELLLFCRDWVYLNQIIIVKNISLNICEVILIF